MKPLARLLVLPLLTLPMAASAVRAADSDRPTAMKLFPYETLAFARVAHGRELYERFQQTGFGAMLNDPELRPFVEDTWSFLGEQYTDGPGEELGVGWDDLRRVPQGEIAVGLIDRGDADMGVLMLADFDGEEADANFFLEQLDERWEAEGVVVEQEEFEGQTLTVIRHGDDRSSSFGYLMKDSCLVASNDEMLLKHLLDRWAGRPPTVMVEAEADDTETDVVEALPGERTLAENENFVAVLQECSTQLEEPPQVVLYANPLGFLRRSFRGNTGATVTMATFPALGIDGILGVGGTMTLATEKWDSVTHLHLLLGNPRSGVLTLLRFERGDITPPDYVPDNVYGYSTAYLDVPGIFDRLGQLVDRFRYEGAFQESIESTLSERLGIDFEQDIIRNLAGRATLLTAFDRPRRMQSEQRALAVTLIDPEVTRAALESLSDRFGDRLEEQEYAGVPYYAFVPRPFRDLPADERPATPAFCVLEDTLVASGSTPLLEAMIDAQQGSGSRLADSIEFKVIQSRVERLTRGRELALFYYENTAEVLRHWYELLQQNETRDLLDTASENFDPAGGFLKVLEQNELPSFETLQPYLAPTGGYLINTSTGLHFMMFDLRRGE